MSLHSPKRKGEFVVVVLTFSAHIITILFSCLFNRKEEHKVREVSEILFFSYRLYSERRENRATVKNPIPLNQWNSFLINYFFSHFILSTGER